MGCGIYAFLVFLGKGRTITKVMGGWGVVHFQPVRLFFQNFLLVSIIFFLLIPCSNFIFFPKIVGEQGGGGIF
jgi:hypothetical protein